MTTARRRPTPAILLRPKHTLLRYDAACRAVSEAKGFEEVRDWEDKAAELFGLILSPSAPRGNEG